MAWCWSVCVLLFCVVLMRERAWSGRIAQLVEHSANNAAVLGSSPNMTIPLLLSTHPTLCGLQKTNKHLLFYTHTLRTHYILFFQRFDPSSHPFLAAFVYTACHSKLSFIDPFNDRGDRCRTTCCFCARPLEYVWFELFSCCFWGTIGTVKRRAKRQICLASARMWQCDGGGKYIVCQVVKYNRYCSRSEECVCVCV